MPKNIFYINGKLLPEDKAKISVFDLGLLRSYGVFDFLRTYNGKPFCLKEHIGRLLDSIKLINLKNNLSRQKLEKIVRNTLKKNKHLKETNIRILVTGGQSKDGLTPQSPSIIVMVTPAKLLPENLYRTGAKLITWPSERFLPQAKTLFYLEAIKALQVAKKKGAVEILYCSKNKELLECATSNFFAVFKNKIITPPLPKVLAGITRYQTINLAKKLGLKTEEKKITVKDLKRASEAFITATNKEILPIVKIDNLKIGQGKPGPITKKLMEEFKKMSRRY